MVFYGKYYVKSISTFPFVHFYTQADVAESWGEELTSYKMTDIKKVIKGLEYLKGEYSHVTIVSDENNQLAVQYSIHNNDTCVLEVPVAKKYLTTDINSKLEYIFTQVLRRKRGSGNYIYPKHWYLVKDEDYVLFLTECKDLKECHKLLMNIAKQYFKKSTSFTIKLFYVEDTKLTRLHFALYGIMFLLISWICFSYLHWIPFFWMQVFASATSASLICYYLVGFINLDKKTKIRTMHRVAGFIAWGSVVVMLLFMAYLFIFVERY